jgi:CheY-like chemotaxis protein
MTHLLYVEDHPPARFLMQAIISDLTPYALTVAANGAEALARAAEQPFDAYIVDLDLPDIEGSTLARRLQERHPAPVILVSAYAEAARLEPLDTVYYLAKPLDPENVAETLQRALARR